MWHGVIVRGAFALEVLSSHTHTGKGFLCYQSIELVSPTQEREKEKEAAAAAAYKKDLYLMNVFYPNLLGDSKKAFGVGIAYDRSDETLICGNCNTYVHAAISE